MDDPRTPAEIADEARKTWDNANKSFVPPNLQRMAELNVEFMASVAAQLQATAKPEA